MPAAKAAKQNEQETSASGFDGILFQLQNAQSTAERGKALASLLSFFNSSSQAAETVVRRYGELRPSLDACSKDQYWAIEIMLTMCMKSGSKEISEHIGEFLGSQKALKDPGWMEWILHFADAQQGNAGYGCVSANYEALRPYILKNLDKSTSALTLLLNIALNGNSQQAVADAEENVLRSSPALRSSYELIAKAIRNSSGAYRGKMFLSFMDSVLELPKMKMQDDPAMLSTAARCLNDIALFKEVLLSKNGRVILISLGMPFTESVGELKRVYRERKELAQEFYDAAIKGDGQAYVVASLLEHDWPYAPKADGADEKYALFKKIVSIAATDDKGDLYLNMLRDLMSDVDADFYIRVFNKINKDYERGEKLDELAKLIGYFFVHPPYVDFSPIEHPWETLKMGGYALSSSGIVKRVFGSVGAFFDLTKGQIPFDNIIDLLLEDGKARKFGLMCLSKGFDFASEYDVERMEKGVSSKQFQDYFRKTVKNLEPETVAKLRDVLQNPSIMNEIYSDPRMKATADSLLKMLQQNLN